MEQVFIVDQLDSEKQYEIGTENSRIESWENGKSGSAEMVQLQAYHRRIFWILIKL